MGCYRRSEIEDAMMRKGYKYFSGGNYDVNIIGIRNSKTKNRVTNAFDDCITLSYQVNNRWHFYCYNCTTDPGTHWAQSELINPKGVAILKPGQYRSAYTLRLHNGQYLALGQQKPVKVYRDANRDSKFDLNEDSLEEGLFGINIHRATGRSGRRSTRVNKWSAGCQVIADNDDWHEFLDILQTSREYWGNSFTYTLLESDDIEVN